MREGSYRIERFHASDAPEVADLVREVYGDKFPVKTAYDPAKLIAAAEKEEFIPIIARAADNRIAGFTGIYRIAPYQRVREMGYAVTRPEHRNKGVSALLFKHGLTTVSEQLGIELMFGEAVCNHTHTQRAAVRLGVAETGLEVDLMPAEAYEKERSASGRVAAVCIFSVHARRPHAVYIPAAYREPLQYIYEDIKDTRTLLPAMDALPAEKKTEIDVRSIESAGLGRSTVLEAGEDFDQVFGQREEELLKSGITILQVLLRMASPSVGEAVNRLRRKGYFLGGVLLRWFDEDGLLMQKIIGEPNWGGIHLHSERMKKILAFIRQDWLDAKGKR